MTNTYRPTHGGFPTPLTGFKEFVSKKDLNKLLLHSQRAEYQRHVNGG